MSHKSVSTRTAVEVRDPVTFDVDGEKFTCRDRIPVSALLRYSALLLSMPDRPEDVTREEARDLAIKAVDILGFFQTALEPAEYERFQAFIDDPDRNVEIETLGTLLLFLVESYTDRPTKPSSG